MRKKQRWDDAEIEKLRSMAGNHSLDQIAQELGRPRGSVATKARELNLSLAFHRRRQNPASLDPSLAGLDLTPRPTIVPGHEMTQRSATGLYKED